MNFNFNLLNFFSFTILPKINNSKINLREKYKILEKIEIKMKNELNKSKLYFTMSRILLKFDIKQKDWVFVSLSGGVDSMVILYLLVKLKYNVIAIHINYGNRKESYFEAYFLQTWCKHLKVHFRKRVIRKIKRRLTKRYIYENESRKLRFNTYRAVLKEFFSCNGIILGHHKGDIEENIVLNIIKGYRLFNLSGMNMFSLIEGINIWRPLLSHPKKDILNFAHKFGVPYFKNSTPTWSTRGRTRNEIFPLFVNVFGKGFNQNLSNIGIESKKFQILIRDNMFQPLWKQCLISQLSIIIKYKKLKTKNSLFWKELFIYICEKKLGVPRIREKPIKQFLQKKKLKFENCFISMRSEFKVYLNKEKIILFHPCLFPLRLKGITWNFFSNFPEKISLTFKRNKNIILGPWKLTIQKVRIRYCDLLSKVKISDICTGNFCYYLPFFNENDSLYFINTKTKSYEIDSLNNLPNKILRTIPLIHAKYPIKKKINVGWKIIFTFKRTIFQNNMN